MNRRNVKRQLFGLYARVEQERGRGWRYQEQTPFFTDCNHFIHWNLMALALKGKKEKKILTDARLPTTSSSVAARHKGGKSPSGRWAKLLS